MKRKHNKTDIHTTDVCLVMLLICILTYLKHLYAVQFICIAVLAVYILLPDLQARDDSDK